MEINLKMVGVFALITLILSCDGVEVRREYHANGSIKSEYEVSDGKKDGYIKQYSESGRLEFEGQYEGNLRVGWHTYYYPNGKIDQKFLYAKTKDNKDRWMRKQKYDTLGQLVSDIRFAKKELSVISEKGSNYSVGDTLVLWVRIENPKYPLTQGVVGYFDEYLNVTKNPTGGTHYFESSDHRIVFRILLRRKGPLKVTGFMRDFEYRPYTDSTGLTQGEDSYFSYAVTVE